MKVLTLLSALLLAAGCLSTPSETTSSDEARPSLPAFDPLTFYHLSDGREVPNNHPEVVAGQVLAAKGNYQSIGEPVFEPSMGITSSGNLFVASFRSEGLLQYTHIIRSMDGGLNWTNVGPFLGPTTQPVVPNSNDPFVAVDKYTDRIVKFDMCATLAGFCVEYSDDEGETWMFTGLATGEQPVALDHQSLAFAPSSEPLSGIYPTTGVFCVNRGPTVAGPWCSSSFDGGITWAPMVPGYPVGTLQCSGLHGHIKGGPDGAFYRGNPSCSGPAVYRSGDGGFTWTEHVIPFQNGTLGHEITVAVDEANNVHAFWIGSNGLPYLASSRTGGMNWTTPKMVGAPGVTAAGFPAITAGADGRVSFAYIGTTVADGYQGETADMEWNGYLGVVMDAFGDDPVITTVQANANDDPLDSGRACGRLRCGGFGDFISMDVDPIGRPYAIMSHNPQGGIGIMVAMTEGPALVGEITPLPPLAMTGPASFS